MYKRDIDPSLTPFLLSLAVTTLRVLLIVSVMQIIGIQMTVFAALIGAIGVAAGLALSGTLQNFTSGVLILILKPFHVGDNIVAQGQEGTVQAIKIFYTVVRTYDNRTVVIPNSKLSNEVIINISSSGNRRLDVEMKFTNGIDFREVKNIVNNVLDHAQSALKVPERRIGISSIEPDGYKVMVNVWLDAHGFVDTKMEIQEKLMEALKRLRPQITRNELTFFSASCSVFWEGRVFLHAPPPGRTIRKPFLIRLLAMKKDSRTKVGKNRISK